MLPPFPRYNPARGPGNVSARQRIMAQWRGIDLVPLEQARALRAQPASAVMPRVLTDLRIDRRRAGL